MNGEPAGAELLDGVRRLMTRRFVQGLHHVAAIVQTASGATYEGVSLEANVGRAAICAEGVAIGAAAVAGDLEITHVVAVGRDGGVVSPCGVCRELITDLAPEARILLPADGGAPDGWTTARELLPSKYRRRWRSEPGAESPGK